MGPKRTVRDYGTVAVVVPTYNRRDLVVGSVKSVIGQTYGNWCCLVVDNGSTDGTAEALASLGDPRLKVLVHERPLGAARARNAGIMAARGCPWVAFLDNDDLWAPSKLERQLSAMATTPVARWSATACVNIGLDLRAQSVNRLRRELPMSQGEVAVPSGQLLELLKEDNRIPAGGSSVLASLDLVMAVGAFNLDVPSCEDWDLWLRLAKESPLAYVDLPLVAYRMWEGQVSTDVGTTLSTARRIRARYFPGSGPCPPAISLGDKRRGLAVISPRAEGCRRRAIMSAPPGAPGTHVSWAMRSAPRSCLRGPYSGAVSAPKHMASRPAGRPRSRFGSRAT